MKRLRMRLLLGAIALVVLAGMLVAFDDTDPEGDKSSSRFCRGDSEKKHPVGERIAERYLDGDYDQVMTWFCAGNGFGQIMLALETGKVTDLTAEDVLAERANGKGWGQIWKEKKLITNESDGKPPWAGPKDKDDKPGQGPKSEDDDKPGQGPKNEGDKPGQGPKDKDDKPGKGPKEGSDDEEEDTYICPDGSSLSEDVVEQLEDLAEEYGASVDELLAAMCGGASLEDLEAELTSV